MLNVVYAVIAGVAVAVVMFAAGLVWEQRRTRQVQPRAGTSGVMPRELSDWELLRKWVAAVAAGIVAFLLALVSWHGALAPVVKPW